MAPKAPVAGEMLRHYRLISEQVSREDIGLILGELESVLRRGIPGDIVELGCYIGTTSLFIRRLLDAYRSDKIFHAYDSFAGLPPKEKEDDSAAGEGFKAGELAASKGQYIREFRHAGLQLPVIHKAWFEDLPADAVPPEIAFAFIDGDFYRSTIAALALVWPHICAGGVALIDDYGREALPGVERAVRAFFHGTVPPLTIAHNIAILKK